MAVKGIVGKKAKTVGEKGKIVSNAFMEEPRLVAEHKKPRTPSLVVQGWFFIFFPAACFNFIIIYCRHYRVGL